MFPFQEGSDEGRSLVYIFLLDYGPKGDLTIYMEAEKLLLLVAHIHACFWEAHGYAFLLEIILTFPCLHTWRISDGTGLWGNKLC